MKKLSGFLVENCLRLINNDVSEICYKGRVSCRVSCESFFDLGTARIDGLSLVAQRILLRV